jgi:L-asparaginase II
VPGSLLAVAERSDVVEEYHRGAVAVVDRSGELIGSCGDIGRAFFIRSAAKPFQAHVALSAGVELRATHLAVACSSHSGDPVHIAMVEDILGRHGLSVSDLRCPPARPFLEADRRLAGEGDLAPSPLYHNCSGKHATLLAASRVAGWDTETYLDSRHPLQVRIGELMARLTREQGGPPGVDGCGLPVWRVTVAGLARAYARLATEEEFGEVRTAMSRYPMLVSGEGRSDGLIGRWTGGVAKGGAAGCIGAAVAGHGVASKAWTGSGQVAAMGVTLALEWLRMLTPALADGLADVFRPPVFGGGLEVGRFRPVAVLESL